ncbi:MAG: cell division protein ZapA [Clostridiales bacterium]|nr:cell division protein ZapA [Clostridiales bacterium]
MEKKKVQIKICGATYSILTDDNAEYVEELGEFIDSEMKNISMGNPSLSSIQCAVLVALDQADSSRKATAAADNLRAQIKDYLEDSARARMEVDVARREIERLNREISNLREKLNS